MYRMLFLWSTKFETKENLGKSYAPILDVKLLQQQALDIRSENYLHKSGKASTGAPESAFSSGNIEYNSIFEVMRLLSL